jgi:hypothetical protein
MAKDICSLLNKYTTQVSSENLKAFYTWLNPKNVVYNQHSLRPRLRFEPIMEDILGMRRRPMSV